MFTELKCGRPGILPKSSEFKSKGFSCCTSIVFHTLTSNLQDRKFRELQPSPPLVGCSGPEWAPEGPTKMRMAKCSPPETAEIFSYRLPNERYHRLLCSPILSSCVIIPLELEDRSTFLTWKIGYLPTI